MKSHNDLALEAQANNDLDKMYRVIKEIAEKQVNTLCRIKGLQFTPSKLEEVTHDATTMFIEENYLKKTSVIKFFKPVVLFCVKKSLYGAPRGVWSSNRKFEMNSSQFDHLHDNVICNSMLHGGCVHSNIEDLLDGEEEDFLKDLLLLDNGDKVLYILYKTLSYKEAILEIEPLVGRKVIYNNAVILNRIHKTLHYHRRN